MQVRRGTAYDALRFGRAVPEFFAGKLEDARVFLADAVYHLVLLGNLGEAPSLTSAH